MERETFDRLQSNMEQMKFQAALGILNSCEERKEGIDNAEISGAFCG